MGVKREQSPLGDQQIGQAQQREQLRRVFGQASVAHLPQAKPILDDVERVFDLGADARLHPLDPVIQMPQLVLRQGTALARPYGHMPSGVGALLAPLFDTPIPRIRENQTLLAMQQGMTLRDIVDVRRLVATVWTRPELASAPICIFMPKCHWLPFFT